jgi:hypothetical protein
MTPLGSILERAIEEADDACLFRPVRGHAVGPVERGARSRWLIAGSWSSATESTGPLSAQAGAQCDDRFVDLARAAADRVLSHPAVRHVELAGSRSRGMHDELSDWDFAVTTSDFAAVARDMPALVAPLHPLGQQWEPLGHFPVYQVLLPGPTKVEYLFLDHTQAGGSPPRHRSVGAISWPSTYRSSSAIYCARSA